jgi:outer membrane protein assembly factor BamB
MSGMRLSSAAVTRTRFRLSVVLAAALVLAGSALVPATAEPLPCSGGARPGGDWPTYGRDLANSHDQKAEDTIGTSAAAGVAPAWAFSAATAGDPGAGGNAVFNATPIVADGCVFAGTAAGNVYALDAATGTAVWHAAVPIITAGSGGAIVGSPAVADGLVVYLVSENGNARKAKGPYAIAYDEHTGAVVWRSAPITTRDGTYTNASTVIYDGLVFFGFSPAEGDAGGQGGFALLDALTGDLVRFTEVIPAVDQARGYAGAGIWSTPAVDTETGYAYVGTSNPYSKQVEHRYTNAIVKIDLDRDRPTFGQVVDAYKGNVDQYNELLTVLRTTPACAETADRNVVVDNPVCGQIDLDFGAAPNLFHDGEGHLLVGDLQKAGLYHAAFADSMEAAWKTVVGAPCALCNAASAAVDATGVKVEGTPGGQLLSLAPRDGGVGWASPVGDGVHYQSIATADGVVWFPDSAGMLDAYDSATGVPLVRRPMAADIGEPDTAVLTSAGATVAEHTVFVTTTGASGGWIVAYRPDGG